MAFRVIANEILKNPGLPLQMPVGDIPLSQLRNSVLTGIEREALENFGITTLKDLATYEDIENLSKQTEIPLFKLMKLSSAIELLIRGSLIYRIVPSSSKKLDYIKIVFFGLDQAGKTSIISYIKKKEPLTVLKEHLPKTRPTVGVDFQKVQFNEIPIILTELGGQKAIRDSYLPTVSNYFKDSNVAVFVIDSTMPERFPEALEFFKAVYQKLTEHELIIPIKIAVHKADTGVMEASNVINEIVKILSQQMNISLVELMNSVFATSIKDSSTMASFFSSIIEENLPIRSYITTGLSTLISLYPLDFCCLVDPTLSRLPLGWVSKLSDLDPKSIINYLLEYTEHFEIDSSSFSSSNPENDHSLNQIKYTIRINQWIRELIFMPVYLQSGKKEFYFVFCYSDDYQSQITADMPPLAQLVQRALDPQLELALLAINSQPDN